jgi:hypothetical protein
MPKDEYWARVMGAKRLVYVSRGSRCPFSIDTLNKYLMLWEMMMNNERAAKNIRQKLYK